MMKTMYAGCLAAAICAVAVGVAFHGSHSRNEVVVANGAGIEQATTADVQQPILDRAEPAPASYAAPPPAGQVEDDQPAPAQAPAQIQEAQQAIEILLASGVWGNEQRMSFYRQLSELPPDRAAQAVRELLVAFNEGRMQMTTVGPPL